MENLYGTVFGAGRLGNICALIKHVIVKDLKYT